MARLWLLAAALPIMAPVAAHEGDTFRPFVSAAYLHDDNLFRLAEGESPGTPREDRYAVYQAGIQVDWRPGRQQFLALASKTLVRYDRNVPLDFDGDEASLSWNWRLGNRLSGNLGINQSTSQSNLESVGRINNIVDRERRFARAEWEFHPRWHIGIGGEASESSNSDPSQRSQDFEQTMNELVLTYRTPKGSSLATLIRRSEADYPNQQTLRIFGVPPISRDVADTSFEQTEYLLSGNWRVSGKLNLRGQGGHVNREYRNELKDPLGGFANLVRRPDHSQFTVRGTAEWFPGARTVLSLTAYQELGEAIDINATSVERHGLRLDAAWMIREKWRLNAGLNIENRDFQGDPSVPNLIRRNDDTTNFTLGVTYRPTRIASINVGVQAGQRDANLANENFEFRSVSASVRADF